MASLATLAAVQPATIKGLGGSSLTGTKLYVKPSRQSLRAKSFRYQYSTTKKWSFFSHIWLRLPYIITLSMLLHVDI